MIGSLVQRALPLLVAVGIWALVFGLAALALHFALPKVVTLRDIALVGGAFYAARLVTPVVQYSDELIEEDDPQPSSEGKG